MADPTFTLSDAVQHYHALSETADRIWSYLNWAGGALIVAMATSKEVAPYKCPLILMFMAFALGNLVILHSSQSEMYAAANDIKAYVRGETGETLPAQFKSILERLDPYSPLDAAVGHLLMDVAIVSVMYFLGRAQQSRCDTPGR